MADLISGVGILPFIASHPEAGGQSIVLDQQLANTSDTYYFGSVLQGSSGLLVPATGNPYTGIIGISAAAGSGNPANASPAVDPLGLLAFVKAVPGVIFEGTLDNSGAFGTGVIAQTDLYTKYIIALDSTSHDWYVDKSSSSNPAVVVVGFKDPIGTVQGRVYFKFLNGATIYE